MQGSIELHREAFSELLQYTKAHVVEFMVELPNSTSRWVPVDYIKHLYKHNNFFCYRLIQICKGLTSKSYRVEDEDIVEDLGFGNIGTTFLSGDMTLALILQEQGRDKGQQSKKAKDL